MKAFIKRQKPQPELDQKFKFRFECEFELTPDDIWDDNAPKRKITIMDVIDRMEDEYCDEVQFINSLMDCGMIESSKASLDVSEITEPNKEENDSEILREGIMAEESTSLDEAVCVVAENVRTLAH